MVLLPLTGSPCWPVDRKSQWLSSNPISHGLGQSLITIWPWAPALRDDWQFSGKGYRRSFRLTVSKVLGSSEGKASYWLLDVHVWASRMRLAARGSVHLKVLQTQMKQAKGSNGAEDGTRDTRQMSVCFLPTVPSTSNWAYIYA